MALITGASSGLGKPFAEIHVKRGGDLVIVVRSVDKLEFTVHMPKIPKPTLKIILGKLKLVTVTTATAQRRMIEQYLQDISVKVPILHSVLSTGMM